MKDQNNLKMPAPNKTMKYPITKIISLTHRNQNKDKPEWQTMNCWSPNRLNFPAKEKQKGFC